MIRTLIFKAVIVLILVIISGCVIKSSQLSGLLDQFDEQSVDFSDNSWLLTYGGYKSVVYAVEVPQGILFTNSFGDAVVFDGWSISQVRGMGRSQVDIGIDDKLDQRLLSDKTRLTATHQCEGWQQRDDSNMVQYSQLCYGDRNYKNSILVNAEGNIAIIRQVIDKRHRAITLSKQN